jgi:hypothetical protein
MGNIQCSGSLDKCGPAKGITRSCGLDFWDGVNGRGNKAESRVNVKFRLSWELVLSGPGVDRDVLLVKSGSLYVNI